MRAKPLAEKRQTLPEWDFAPSVQAIVPAQCKISYRTLKRRIDESMKSRKWIIQEGGAEDGIKWTDDLVHAQFVVPITTTRSTTSTTITDTAITTVTTTTTTTTITLPESTGDFKST
jgi:hypothetical protein